MNVIKRNKCTDFDLVLTEIVLGDLEVLELNVVVTVFFTEIVYFAALLT